MKGKLGFIGGGAMGEALVKAILETDLFLPREIVVSDIKKKRREKIASEYGVNTLADNEQLVDEVDYIVLAVKPQEISKVLKEVKGKISAEQIVLSIAAGVSVRQLEAPLAEGIAVVRLMPNTPALIGEGAIAYALGTSAGREEGALVEDLFVSAGTVIEVEEELMDAVTAVSGSGPAYIYVLIEALADAGVYEGLPREKAVKLAAQTVKGASEMVLKSEKQPGELKNMVASPGGTTITGLKELEEAGFRSALYKAVEAAAEKSRQLGGE